MVFSLFDPRTGIIEPGQRVDVSHFEVENKSTIPSPQKYVSLTIEENDVISSNSEFRNLRSLKGQEIMKCEPTWIVKFS